MCIETIKADLEKCTTRISLEESKDREILAWNSGSSEDPE